MIARTRIASRDSRPESKRPTKVKRVYEAPSFLTCLAILFITLKLCGVINWSWWLVLLPLYAPIAAILALGLGLGLFLGLGWFFCTMVHHIDPRGGWQVWK